MDFDDIPIGFAVIDFLCCLLLVLFVWAHPKHVEQSSIKTEGKYVIEMHWPNHLASDVDLWVKDPAGNIVWFGNKDQGVMHLEHDDLGIQNDKTDGHVIYLNEERVILRGTIPGEYIVNVHLYRKWDAIPIHVTVSLFKLIGTDKKIYEKKLVLTYEGQEKTAFRFTIDGNENVGQFNNLSARFVGK